MPSVRVIGPGRVGTAVSGGLAAAGWEVAPSLGRGDDVADAGVEVDLVLIATPDASIADVAGRIRPTDAVVGHLSGTRGLDDLAPHRRRTGIHPLASIPAGPLGQARLTGGIRFAVIGDPMGRHVVAALGGEPFEIADEDRVAYHAAACIASNHLVALMGQVERVAALADLPLSTFFGLVQGTVDAVVELGPKGALTGPAARGDTATLARHLAVLPEPEHASYTAMADLARRLATEGEDPR